LREAAVVSPHVEWFACLLGAQKLLQRLRPDQAADMSCEDSIDASFHLVFRAWVE
jgi:hypothetical protein